MKYEELVKTLKDNYEQAEGDLLKGLTLKEVIEKNSGIKKSLMSKAKGTVAAVKAAKKAVGKKKS